MTSSPRFHLAFPVRDLAEARALYGSVLGCREARSSDEWIDFDFFDHQIVAHLTASPPENKAHNFVDGEEVPVRHFGVILSMPEWTELTQRLHACGTRFAIEPQIRFKGSQSKQATFFVNNPGVVVSKFAQSLISDSRANFETKTTPGINGLPVSLRFRNSPGYRYKDQVNFGIGTLAAMRWNSRPSPTKR